WPRDWSSDVCSSDLPARPQCGFSAAVVDVLCNYAVPLHTVDVLADPAIRQEIKTYSDWPTIPQLYLNRTFVGGCDIVREMHETEIGRASCRERAENT